MEKWITLNMDIRKVIEVCSDQDEEKLLKSFDKMNRGNIHDVFRYHKFNERFIDMVSCYSDGTHVIGDICPSYTEFLKKLFKTLNVNPELEYLLAKDDENLEDVLKARIEVLKSIPKKSREFSSLADETELKREFPELYETLQIGREYINNITKKKKTQKLYKEDITKLKSLLEDESTMSDEQKHPLQIIIEELQKQFNLKKEDTTLYKQVIKIEEKIMEQDEIIKKQEQEYYRCALSPNYDKFILQQVELYTRFVEKRKLYEEKTKETNYNKFFQVHFDTQKLVLYITYGYIKALENTKEREKKLKYLELIEKYLNNSKVDRETQIVVDGETINYDTIKKMKNNATNILNRIDIKLEWELLPSGDKLPTIHSSDNIKRRGKMPEEEKERLNKVGKELLEFYLKSNYIAKAIGLKTFEGYFAYIYPNGVVVLDKDYREGYPTTAEGAIYTMYAKDFELLSGIGKTELMKHPFLIDHNYHTENWQAKISKYINSEATEEQKEEAKKLIKRLQNKKETE